MRTHHTHLTEAELTLLEEQFRQSPYGQRQQCSDGKRNTTLPTRLSIFDFDSTLFLSPLLSSTLWDSWLVNAVTTENLLGPGFWRDIRSLPLENESVTGDGSSLTGSAWHGWWNEDVIMEARRAIADPQTLTVLLTGRRAHPFGHRIKHMLSTKNLDFDILGLRPDPAIPTATKTTAAAKTSACGGCDTNETPNNDGLNFNEIPDTFLTTMDFKSSFILHLKAKLPSLQEIVVWDDRPSQIPILETFVATLVDQDYFEQGSVEPVIAVRPKYNPAWEFELVEAMVTSHNRALEKAFISKAPPESVVVDNLGTCLGSYDPVQLVRRPFTTSVFLNGNDDYSVLRLVPSSVDCVREAFDAMYQQHVKQMEQQQPAWQFQYGEQPVFFGDIAFGCSGTTSLAASPLAIRRLRESKNVSDSNQQVTLVVTGWDIGSSPSLSGSPIMDRGLTLRVRVLELDQVSTDSLTSSSASTTATAESSAAATMTTLLDNELILPLWYKPSMFQKLSNLPYHWTFSPGKYDGLELKAYLDRVYLYGLDKKK